MAFSDEATKSGNTDRKIVHSSFNGVVNNRNEMMCDSSSYCPPKKQDHCATGNSVGALIAKSKKAASSLFTLLHAKNCKLGPNRCSHAGCPEAKLIHLHLKTCNSESSAVCPIAYKGCVDARKLLLHYRRCRDIRSRQAANQVKTNQHVCLVCSLVARNAKGNFDRSRSTSPKSSKARKHLIPLKKLSSDQMSSPSRHSLHQLRARPRSVSMPAEENDLSKSLLMSSPRMMPPPPPRFSSRRREGGELHSTVADSVNRALNVPSSDETISSTKEAMLRNALNSSGSNFRPRSESLDTSHAHPEQQSMGDTEELAEAPKSVEFQLPQPPRRRRSASCHVLTSKISSDGLLAIHEEPVGEELQHIFEGEK